MCQSRFPRMWFVLTKEIRYLWGLHTTVLALEVLITHFFSCISDSVIHQLKN